STSRVGLPRLSRISRAWRVSMADIGASLRLSWDASAKRRQSLGYAAGRGFQDGAAAEGKEGTPTLRGYRPSGERPWVLALQEGRGGGRLESESPDALTARWASTGAGGGSRKEGPPVAVAAALGAVPSGGFLPTVASCDAAPGPSTRTCGGETA